MEATISETAALRNVVMLRSSVAVLLVCFAHGSVFAQNQERWKPHDPSRPKPRVVSPGPVAEPAAPPSDAIVLFNGRDLSEWVSGNGSAARWKVENGYFEVAPGTGTLSTRRRFGPVQLHIEWASPAPAKGEGQDRGNSGVFLMGRYEVQILDSHNADTYADGQAGAIYGQYPPLVNASRPPGEWQTFDIIFDPPRFSEEGRGDLVKPAFMTVFHNGILIHDHVELFGITRNIRAASYEVHDTALPLTLQDHAHPVRFRNIWIRPLEVAARFVGTPR